MSIINNRLKNSIRDFIPKQYQVPLKYYFNKIKTNHEPEMELLKYLVKKNDLVIDVGGNRGIYAYQFWKLGAKVEIFEPNPTCIQVLKPWMANKSNINIHTVGLSNNTGSVNLHIPIDNNGVEHDASASVENVEFEHYRDQLIFLKTLDSYSFKDVSFIKIDVEGHEYSVIKGATKLLNASKPALLVEIEQRHNSRPISEVFEKILSFGYKGFFLKNNILISLESFDVSLDQSIDNFNKSKPKYINNFLFLDSDKINRGEYDILLNKKRRLI